MNTIDAWIIMETNALDTVFTNHKANGGFLNQGIRGYWKEVNGYEVCNVLCNKSDLDAFVAAHAADISVVYGWSQGDGLDSFDAPTVPQGVLDVMQDHPDGSPAIFENPNFGHMFLGQKDRIFAGEFSTDFNEDFY